MVNLIIGGHVTKVMSLPGTYQQLSMDEQKNSDHRRLKRLRVLLILWIISLVATVIWYTLSS